MRRITCCFSLVGALVYAPAPAEACGDPEDECDGMAFETVIDALAPAGPTEPPTVTFSTSWEVEKEQRIWRGAPLARRRLLRRGRPRHAGRRVPDGRGGRHGPERALADARRHRGERGPRLRPRRRRVDHSTRPPAVRASSSAIACSGRSTPRPTVTATTNLIASARWDPWRCRTWPVREDTPYIDSPPAPEVEPGRSGRRRI
jgi:hypothetical protein